MTPLCLHKHSMHALCGRKLRGTGSTDRAALDIADTDSGDLRLHSSEHVLRHAAILLLRELPQIAQAGAGSDALLAGRRDLTQIF